MIGALLADAKQRLAVTGDTPGSDAHMLLAHVLGRERSWLLAHGSEAIAAEDAAAFEALCAQRARGCPVAYLTGSAGFYGREFLVSPDVLVPRPESEHVVEAALAHVAHRPPHALRILDVGTGSGALAITLAAELSGARVVGTDISLAALEVARANARRLGVEPRCRFLAGDLLEPVKAEAPFDVIVANLPYVPTRDIPSPPDALSFEPRIALDGGADGLSAYRRLLAGLSDALAERGLALLEAAPPTTGALAGLARAVFPDAEVGIGTDYAGRERFVRAAKVEIACAGNR